MAATGQKSWRRALALSMGTAMGPVLLAAPPLWAQEARIGYDIPAQPLAQALMRFSQASGMQVFFDPAALRGKTSPGAQGALTRGQALAALMAGSGLGYSIEGNAARIQAPQPAAAAGAEGGVTLDQVTLTAAGGTTEGSGSYVAPEASGATGLPLTIRETPQSVSVVTNQRIQDQALQTTQEVLSYTTGVRSTPYETDRDDTYSRGMWIYSYVIDGVSLDSGAGFAAGASVLSSTAPYDRVEVVRGATGLLTGTGEPSAAVHIERKQATATETTGQVELRYGSWNQVGAVVDVGGKLDGDGRLRARFVADVGSSDSFRDRYHVRKQTYYGTLAWDATEQTTLTFSLEHRDYDPSASEWGGWPSVYSDGSKTHFPRSFSNSVDWTYWKSRRTMATARVDHDFGNGWTGKATLSGVKAMYDAELLAFFYGMLNPDGTGLEPRAWKGRSEDRQLALDASVSGPVQLFGRDHDLNFGVQGRRNWQRSTSYGFDGEAPIFDNINDFDGHLPRPDFYQTSQTDWGVTTTQYSAYGSGRFQITDPLTLVLGGRYTDWKADSRHFETFTPFIGLVYDLNDTWSLYASHTAIFNPQDARDRYGRYLDPVEGKSSEIGAKAEIGDNILISMAYFRTYRDNVAMEDGNNVVPGTPDQAYVGAKGITAKGLELELSGEIAPGWQLFVGASTLKTTNPDGSRTATEQPSRMLKAFTTYKLPGQWDRWTVGGGVRVQNRTWADAEIATGSIPVYQGGYAVWDAMLRYDISEDWAAQLNVSNVLDKTYYHTGGSGAYYGAPRNALLTITARF